MAKITNAFSTNLQALRKKKGVTQEQLASYLGVSPQAVSKWENGSYPEGDLLPKISEYFEVSISYLYGQEKEKVSIEQEVQNVLRDVLDDEIRNENFDRSEYFDKILDIAWAFQISAYKSNKYYYKRPEVAEGERTVSVISDNAGYGYYNLNPDTQFYSIVREPEKGFAANIHISDRMRNLFKALGEPGGLETLFCFLTLNCNECITVSSIADKVGIGVEQVQSIIKKFNIGNDIYKPISCIDVIKKKETEKAYITDLSGIAIYLILLLAAETIINPPQGYTMQIGNRNKPWFDKKDVDGILKFIQENRK